MTEAPERNSPDGAVSRGCLLPVVCSDRISSRKPALILSLQFKTENSFHTERNHYCSSPRQGRRRSAAELTFPLPATDTLNAVHAVARHIRLYQFLFYRRFANVNVGMDAAVRETHCKTQVVTLVLQSVDRGRGAYSGCELRSRFHTKIVFIIK
jgi:hypothetical protein